MRHQWVKRPRGSTIGGHLISVNQRFMVSQTHFGEPEFQLKINSMYCTKTYINRTTKSIICVLLYELYLDLFHRTGLLVLRLFSARPVTADSALYTPGRRWRRADTNVVTIKFNQLKTPSNMHTGEVVNCAGCTAVLSHISRLKAGETGREGEKLWRCEFCDYQNYVDVEEEEIPQANDVTYMLEPAPCTKAAGPSGHDESLVIFCVDTSGSMCVSTPVRRFIQLHQ